MTSASLLRLALEPLIDFTDFTDFVSLSATSSRLAFEFAIDFNDLVDLVSSSSLADTFDLTDEHNILLFFL